MENFQCTGDCLKCGQGQRLYCASQHSYHTMRIVVTMQEEINGLKAKVDAMQSREEPIFNPMAAPEKPDKSDAQSGDGAEE